MLDILCAGLTYKIYLYFVFEIQLVLEYGTDEDVTSLVDTYDWHFVPVMNPDGYSYTWTTVMLYFLKNFYSNVWHIILIHMQM